MEFANNNSNGKSRLRVSMSALIKIVHNNKFLIVRNLHRPNIFSPFGGVYKYFDSAKTYLDSMGFETDGYREEKDLARIEDLKCDLRGFLPSENDKKFKSWFVGEKQRETLQCPHREFLEELKEIDMDSSIIEIAKKLGFKKIYSKQTITIENGDDQYRWIDIYEPYMENSSDYDKFIEHLFSIANEYPGLLIVDKNEIYNEASEQGKTISETVSYFLESDQGNKGISSPFTSTGKALEDIYSVIKTAMYKEADAISEPILHRKMKKSHSDSIVASFCCKDNRYIIKYYPENNTYALKEKWAYDLLKKENVNINRPILIDSSRNNFPAYVILEFIEGKRLSECQFDKQHICNVIESISKLHSIKFKNYGEIFERNPSINCQSKFADYAISMIEKYRDRIRTCQNSKSYYSQTLLDWADGILRAEDINNLLFSTLSSDPCLCHSDIKLTDIILREKHDQSIEYVILDFDNMFSFVPEYDLCRLHFSLFQEGNSMELSDFCEILAPIYKVSKDAALKGLNNIYPLLLLRLLSWGTKQNDETLIEEVEKMGNLVLSDEN